MKTKSANMKTKPQLLLAATVLAAASLALVGCKSLDQPASASFASVRIQGRTPEQIRAATLVVFEQDGYRPVRLDPANLVFEKEASRWNQIAYGDWVDDKPVWVRVKASIQPISADTFRLQCNAFVVRSKGDAVFEEEVRLKNNRSKPYQALLDKVLGQLKR
jgi:hypothetical protein